VTVGVSANAHETQPAKLLAVFVVDTNKTELTIPFEPPKPFSGAGALNTRPTLPCLNQPRPSLRLRGTRDRPGCQRRRYAGVSISGYAWRTWIVPAIVEAANKITRHVGRIE
jgi:hypothetical protein